VSGVRMLTTQQCHSERSEESCPDPFTYPEKQSEIPRCARDDNVATGKPRQPAGSA